MSEGQSIGPLLAAIRVGVGRDAALLSAVKVTRFILSERGFDTAVSLDTIEDRIMRRDPAEPSLIALRVCNAEAPNEFVAGVALLSLFKAAAYDEFQEGAAAALIVAGMMLDVVADDWDRLHCRIFLSQLIEPGIEPDQVAAAIEAFNRPEVEDGG